MVVPFVLIIKYDHKRTSDAKIFIGEYDDHKKFVELAMKYIYSEVNSLSSKDKITNSCIVADGCLVYATDELSLNDLDAVCKIAKDVDVESVNIIMDREDLYYVSNTAKKVAKNSNIPIYNVTELYNAVYNNIQRKGGESVRECVCK